MYFNNNTLRRECPVLIRSCNMILKPLMTLISIIMMIVNSINTWTMYVLYTYN